MTLSVGIVASAEEQKTANIIGTAVAIRTEPNTKTSSILARVSNVSVTVISSVEGEQAEPGGTKTWYKIKYSEHEGYVYGAYVSFPPSSDDYIYDENFEENIKNFPDSYRDALRALHSKYPNWQFVAHNIDVDFDAAIDLQYSPSDLSKRKKMVELVYGGNEWRDMRSYDSDKKVWIETYKGWTYASRAAIAYFVDPRTYLNEKNIFAFLEQSYNKELQTKDGLRTVVANTFLAKGYDGDADAYLDDIMLAAEQSGVSPYVLAAAIILEVGVDGSTVVSGTWEAYDGAYKGYYNFYNWNATGEDVIKNALEFAKQQKDPEWNTREGAIVGGAKMYADGYVAIGQDTYYYKNYNYVNDKSVNHQYAESVYGTLGDATRISPAFIDNVSGSAVFKIPVFKNMPEKACPVPTVDGNSGDNSGSQTPDAPPKPSTPSGPTPSTPPEPPKPVIKKGDTNNDGNINAVDLAAVKMDILGVKKLQGDAIKAGDVNDDEVINAVDLAAIKMHILGVKTIS